MKLLSVPLISLMVIMSGCTIDSVEQVNNQTKEKAEQSKSTNIGGEKHTKSNIESSNINREGSGIGSFDIVEKVQNVGEYQSGPITIDVKRVSLKSGAFNTDDHGYLPSGKQQLIDLVIEISTTDNEIIFNDENIHVSTNTGESFDKKGEYLSSILEAQFLNSYMKSRQLAYYLEGELEEINNINFKIEAPTSENGESLGKDIEFDVEF